MGFWEPKMDRVNRGFYKEGYNGKEPSQYQKFRGHRGSSKRQKGI
jgi:hypothetical protein